MIPSTRAIVGRSSPRSPCNARSAASIAYATDDTGSPITANANATSRIGRLLKIERTAAAGIRRRASTGSPPRRPDFPARLPCVPALYDIERAPSALARPPTTFRGEGDQQQHDSGAADDVRHHRNRTGHVAG